MTSAHVDSIHVLDDLKGAFAQFGTDAREALDGAGYELAQVLEWVAERQTHWKREVERCEAGVAAAVTALNWCLASGDAEHPPMCSAQATALAAAQQRLRQGQEEILNVQRWTKTVQEAALQYRRQAARLAAALEKEVPNARTVLGNKIDELQGYQAVTVNAERSLYRPAFRSEDVSSPKASDTVGSVSPIDDLMPPGLDDLLHGGPPDLACAGDVAKTEAEPVDEGDKAPHPRPSGRSQVREVPISQIDLSDSPVHGPQDFQKGTSPEEMTDWFRQLQSVVRPAVQRGADAEYFTDIDTQFGLNPAKGYRAVYDIFYGEKNAISLDWAVDRYVVVNGYHRLHIATQMGLRSVPAVVIGTP